MLGKADNFQTVPFVKQELLMTHEETFITRVGLGQTSSVVVINFGSHG